MKIGYLRCTSIALCLLVLFSSLLAQTQSKPAPEEKGVDLIWGVKIPMRDGVKLNAAAYKPKGMREPLPRIVAAGKARQTGRDQSV